LTAALSTPDHRDRINCSNVEGAAKQWAHEKMHYKPLNRIRLGSCEADVWVSCELKTTLGSSPNRKKCRTGLILLAITSIVTYASSYFMRNRLPGAGFPRLARSSVVVQAESGQPNAAARLSIDVADSDDAGSVFAPDRSNVAPKHECIFHAVPCIPAIWRSFPQPTCTLQQYNNNNHNNNNKRRIYYIE